MRIDKAFNNSWSNNTHNMNIANDGLNELLSVATKHKLFQFNANLHEHIAGVAMSSLLGLLMANAHVFIGRETRAREEASEFL